MPPITPINMGRRRRGIDCARMMKHPERRPAEPNPATALPTTSIVDVVAVPQSNEPAIEMALANKKTRLTEKSVYALPNNAQSREDFEWLRVEIEGSGGEAVIFSADHLVPRAGSGPSQAK